MLVVAGGEEHGAEVGGAGVGQGLQLLDDLASELAAREPRQETEADLLETALWARGSSKPAMVELGGIEPPSVERLATALRPFP